MGISRFYSILYRVKPNPRFYSILYTSHVLCPLSLQALRNHEDMRWMKVPDKYKTMGTFYKVRSPIWITLGAGAGASGAGGDGAGEGGGGGGGAVCVCVCGCGCGCVDVWVCV